MHLSRVKHRSAKAPRNAAGFTLIEAMIALTILAFGLLTIAAMQLSGIRGNAFGADLSEATAVTQQEIETLLARPTLASLALANGNDVVTGARGAAYARSWVVNVVNTDYATITVTTTWNDSGWRRPRTVTLSTVYARRGNS
jgi:prepilin-type N-terminal cleavage/methylation domain-containing protein